MLEKIKTVGEELKGKTPREILEYAKAHRKVTEKLILGVLVAICLIIYLAGGSGEDIDVLAADGASGEGLTASEEAGDGVSSSQAAIGAGQIYIDVAGAVKEPGVVILAEGARVFQAIDAAGGARNDGDTEVLNLALALSDGDKLYVPTYEEVASGEFGEGVGAASGAVGIAGGGGGTSGSNNGKININTADSATLQQLNGVGAVTAAKIIDYRQSSGNFKSIEEIKNVSGIGDKTYEKLKDEICV